MVFFDRAISSAVTMLIERSHRAAALDRVRSGILPEQTHAVIVHVVSVSLAESVAKVDS